MSTERFNIIFQQYPEEMELSKEKRTIYLHLSEGNKLPKNVTDSLSIGYKVATFRYYTDKIGWIYHTKDDQKVIRNKKSAGKPNMLKISGQSIWNESVSRWTRNNLKKFLTDYFTPFIVRQLPEKIESQRPNIYYHFEFIFYIPVSLRGYSKIQDIDNHAYPYVKGFMDTITLLKLIPDDSAQYFRGYYPRYVECMTEEERRLEVKIHFCANNENIR